MSSNILPEQREDRVLVRHGFLELTETGEDNYDNKGRILIKGSNILALRSGEVWDGRNTRYMTVTRLSFGPYDIPEPSLTVMESVQQILEAITLSYQQARGSR